MTRELLGRSSNTSKVHRGQEKERSVGGIGRNKNRSSGHRRLGRTCPNSVPLQRRQDGSSAQVDRRCPI